jgi:poly(3-hydroxybutyrate) depolymerase
LTGAGHGWPGGGTSGVPAAIIGSPTTVVHAAREAWSFASHFTRH